jgi:hypothetical protein
MRRAQAHGARYSLSAWSFSNLRMDARLDQSGMEPGATMRLHANVTEYGMPLERRATVLADVTGPDGVVSPVTLSEGDPGSFGAAFVALIPGTYRILVRALGATARGLPFTREQALTGAVFAGGDQPPVVTTDPADRLCEWLICLLNTDGIARLLKQHEIDPGELERCIATFCRPRRDEGVPR